MHLAVDIDQTVFPLLRALAHVPGGENLQEKDCHTWDSLDSLLQRPTEDMIHEAIQMDVAEKVGSYMGARDVLLSLAEENIEIAFATHRNKRYRQTTKDYLRSQGLDDFPLYIDAELEKADLLFSDGVLVDDAPHVIQRTRSRGLQVTTLAHAYNKQASDRFAVPRGESWFELDQIIRSMLF